MLMLTILICFRRLQKYSKLYCIALMEVHGEAYLKLINIYRATNTMEIQIR